MTECETKETDSTNRAINWSIVEELFTDTISKCTKSLFQESTKTVELEVLQDAFLSEDLSKVVQAKILSSQSRSHSTWRKIKVLLSMNEKELEEFFLVATKQVVTLFQTEAPAIFLRLGSPIGVIDSFSYMIIQKVCRRFFRDKSVRDVIEITEKQR
jgi:hypothetical protein